jgi:hypothetical protein
VINGKNIKLIDILRVWVGASGISYVIGPAQQVPGGLNDSRTAEGLFHSPSSTCCLLLLVTGGGGRCKRLKNQ